MIEKQFIKLSYGINIKVMYMQWLEKIFNKSVFFVITICLFVSSCRFNTSYNNREADKQDGEELIVEFYELLKNKEYNRTYTFFDKRFFEATDTQKLNEIYDISFEKLGDVESYDIEKWETQAVVGTDPKTNYVFQLNVKRSDFGSKETLTLIKEENEIKIIGYHVDSEGFFK